MSSDEESDPGDFETAGEDIRHYETIENIYFGEVLKENVMIVNVE